MELLADLLMPSLWAFLACVGFGLVYNIQGAGILICGFGGALGWFFYLIARQWGASWRPFWLRWPSPFFLSGWPGCGAVL